MENSYQTASESGADTKFYGGSLDGYECVRPTKDYPFEEWDKLDALLAKLKPDPIEEERFLIGMPMSYQEFSLRHHPTHPFHLAAWHLSLFETDYERGIPIYIGSEPARSAGLGLLSDAFIKDFFSKMDVRGWQNADGTPIKNALTFTLDFFDEWRKAQLALPPHQRACEFGDDGFPKELGVYNDYLWSEWHFFNWDLGDGTWVTVPPPRGFDNLAVRGLVPNISDSAWEKGSNRMTASANGQQEELLNGK